MDVEVILVDEDDHEIGVMEKIEAHKKGKLHRAFSIFIFNEKNELLLQKRSVNKYHSGGLWTNTCCGHPLPGESIDAAATRRLLEEMGLKCEMKKIFHFQYTAQLDHEMIENELDHVLFGRFNENPKLNLLEADDYEFESILNVKEDIESHPEKFTEWFKICFEKVFYEANKFFSK